METTIAALTDVVKSGICDLAMAGIAVTPERATDVLFSTPYLDETLAFVTRDHRRGDFATWASIRELGAVRVAAPDLPYYRAAVKARAPEIVFAPLRDMADLFSDDQSVVAYVLPAERGSVLTLLHPEYTVVVPQPDPMKLPMAYPLARSDQRWAAYVNTWIDLKRRDGTIDGLRRHWIMGEAEGRPAPRWSVVRNVFHWVH
jgi:ABC-type amino acid transport substrate-binding protein